MSTRDHSSIKDHLPFLRGRRCFTILAANSIKLMLDRNDKSAAYLWINFPWRLCCNGEQPESSDTCPNPGSAESDTAFRIWAGRFAEVSESCIQKIGADADGSLRIDFMDGYQLRVPSDPIEDPDSWYDHWYFEASRTDNPFSDG